MTAVYRTAVLDYSDSQIWENRLFNVYVVGVPRSGTSMMTKCVQELGVNIISTTEEDANRERYNSLYKQKFGEYHPNPNGFYEIGEHLISNYLKLFEKPYSGCKMILPFLSVQLDFLSSSPSKVIVMNRKPEAIKASQEAFYNNDVKISYLRTCLTEAPIFLKKRNIDYIVLNYEDIIKNPAFEIAKVSGFINAPKENFEKAVNIISPELYRFKGE